MCVDEDTGCSHTVGELVSGMRPVTHSRLNRPAYREISPDHDIPDADQEEEIEEEVEEEEEPKKEPKYRYTPSGEVILRHGHPSWLGYTKALFLVLLLLIAAGLLMPIQLEYAIIALLCATSTLIIISIARYSHDYIVTHERVELIWGIIGRSSKEARICDIRSIDVYESGLKGLLGLGTIDFSTAANAGIEVQFKDMRQAHEVKDLVRKLQKGVDPTED
jgi:membrane protein YdbS with pleckstrin-like domain